MTAERRLLGEQLPLAIFDGHINAEIAVPTAMRLHGGFLNSVAGTRPPAVGPNYAIPPTKPSILVLCMRATRTAPRQVRLEQRRRPSI